jgi:hypothetical protein
MNEDEKPISFYDDELIKMFLDDLEDHFKKNPNILSNPEPKLDIFTNSPKIPNNNFGTIMNFK